MRALNYEALDIILRKSAMSNATKFHDNSTSQGSPT